MSDRGNMILRWGDRFIGIPLVFLLGLFRFKRKKPKHFKSVGILATAAIGDTLLISPVIKDFIQKYPETKITIFCGNTNRGTFDMVLPGMNIVTIPVGNPFKSSKLIRQYKFDLFLDFGPWPRINSILTYFAKAKYKVGFKSISQYRHFIYDKPVPHLNSCHEIDNLRRLVRDLGVESTSIPMLGKHTPNTSDPYVVIHMFPSGYKAHYKEWSDNNWASLINGLTKENVKVSLTGAPKDVPASQRIVNMCDNKEFITQLAGKTNLKEAGVVLQNATLVVSVNTGIMHMAAAYNAPVIALHGPTSPLRWGPICNNKYDFEASTVGAGCLHLGFEYIKKDDHSLDSIKSSLVLEQVLLKLRS